MSRLPTPGSDNDSWGSILNDYLSQSLASDGTLKSGIVDSSHLQTGAVTNTTIAPSAVSTTTLQNNSVTTAKIADGSITAGKLAPGTIQAATSGMRSLLIYYAAPNVINGQFNNTYAAGVLARYDDIVLGAGLQDPNQTYYASTVAIIQEIATLSPETVIWGYINCGVTTGNVALGTLQTQIDQWISIGAKGIFCDTMGYDFHTSRSRQNSILSYIHSKGVGAIINAFTAADVFASTVDATYNPTGTATVANSSDVLLLESWVCNSDAYASPYYATFSDIKTRGDIARNYRSSLGIRIFAANILSHTSNNYLQIKVYRDIAEALARVWRLDGSGIAASTYSSTGPDAGLVTPQFTAFQAIPQRPTAGYVLNGPWTQVQAPDLGITVNYDNTGNVHTWTQQ